MRRFCCLLGLGLCAAVVAVSVFVWEKGERAQAQTHVQAPTPVLAYYYIWFDPSSWDRAKVDFPLLGHYSSDDSAVMRQHIVWAKASGIEGFIVSWKSTAQLNARLDKLVTVAREEDFKLTIIYQGLDFDRNPQPATRIGADLDYFADRYAGDPVFGMFGKPVVIWSGTFKFSTEDIAAVTAGRRDRLLLLATEKSAADFERVASFVDGNAYYWASVNPWRQQQYQERLDGLSAAVDAQGGLWIAPAAPGFDARLVGGSREVERRDGETLRREMSVALNSAPDAIGLISWNEFSENTHVEPSERHGQAYLDVLADLRDVPGPVVGDFDSSEPGSTNVRDGLFLLGGIGVLVIAGMGALAYLRMRRQIDLQRDGSAGGAR